MSAVQIAFAAGLATVLASVVAFAALVVGTGGAGRLLRAPRDHAELGRAAFVAHRLTGFAVFAFLALHILDVGLYSVSHRLYDEVQSLYGTAPVRVFECGLLFAILFHVGNGLRLLTLDATGLGLHAARRMLVAVVTLTVVAGVAGSVLILRPVLP